MPRFVVLIHDWPELHWDFMLEEGDFLRTWRLLKEPVADSMISAEQVNPHRLFYLDYEGPVSQGRGNVTRWDHGVYHSCRSSGETLTIRIEGQKLKGFVIQSGNSAKCTFYFSGGELTASEMLP